MNSLFVLIIASTSTLLPALAFGGNATGNGGNAVVCTDAAGKVTSAEIFDLYEGRALRNAAYKESTADYKTQARAYISYVGEALGLTLQTEGSPQANLEENFQNLKFLPPGTGLAPINDSNSLVFPKGCQLVQTANFVDTIIDPKSIYVDSDVWESLSETQKAALLVHETIYQFLRHPGPKGNFVETDSVRTRMVVSQLFNGAKPEPLETLVSLSQGTNPLYCSTEEALEADRRSSSFFMYKNKNGDIILQFLSLADRILLSRTTLNVKAYASGSIDDGGNVTSQFIENLNVLINYSNAANARNQIRVIDGNGYDQYETFKCIPAMAGMYNRAD